MTIVAPTAMIAKKLASVAVWISVYEFRKLLTVAPVSRSTCEPASEAQRDAEDDDDQDQPGLLRAEQAPEDGHGGARNIYEDDAGLVGGPVGPGVTDPKGDLVQVGIWARRRSRRPASIGSPRVPMFLGMAAGAA